MKHDDQYYSHTKAFKKLESEDRYFMEQDREYIEEQKKEIELEQEREEEFKKRQQELQKLEERKQLHYMKCPKCGADLEPKPFSKITIDRCTECFGIWLDMKELERVREKGAILVKALLKNFFDSLGVKEE
ncbi:MAG: zf-TFIIB domain-containing protein [Candidatus Eremiobacteraeota bacterium]|nr:zf-TFIIB domain-containing protein [Candidatus Eremiobacteraeota bacterium]